MRMSGRSEEKVPALGRQRKDAAADQFLQRVGSGTGWPASIDVPVRCSMRTISSA